jgi:hypothetical protein
LTQHRKKPITAGAIVAVAAGLAYYVARDGNGFDWPVFAATVTRLDWGWLGLALAAACGTYAIRT